MQELNDLIDRLEHGGGPVKSLNEVIAVLRLARARIEELEKAMESIATGRPF